MGLTLDIHQEKMKKIVCTLNVFKDVIHDNARASMREAARRWGADYVEILQPLGDVSIHHYYQKLQIDRHLPEDCRAVYYDADVVIRSDCPSPFDVVPVGSFGFVRSHHPSHAGATPHVYTPMLDFAAKFNKTYGPDVVREFYPNNGMLVFDTTSHRVVFEQARRMVDAVGFDSRWEIADQGFLSVAALISDATVFFLPPMFQMHGDVLWSGWSPEMLTLGYHFCGPVEASIAIPRTVWDDLGPDRRISGTDISRWHQGKPIHLCDGQEIPMLIREMSLIRAGCIVEVGSFLGGSAWYGAQIARDNYSSYHCIDAWDFDDDLTVTENHYRGFIENMRDAKLTDHITVIRKKSVEASLGFKDGSVDLVFLDGDHSFDGCSADIVAWWPKLRKGGVMLGHDYCARLQGVIDAVNHTLGAPDELSPGAYPIWKKVKLSNDLPSR